MTSRPKEPEKEEIERELALIRKVLNGNVPAWHEFVEAYSDTIYNVARHFFADEDTVGDIYVTVLDTLYRGRLSKFQGKSRLGRWVAVVTRNLCRDAYRQLYGRQRSLKAQEGLTPFEDHLFRLYYQEGHGLREAYEQARERSGEQIPFSEVFPILAEIERKLGSKKLAHLADRAGVKNRIVYWEELDNLLGEDDEDRPMEPSPRPEKGELPFEPGPARAALESILQELSDTDRLFLKMKYYHGLKERELMDVLGFETAESLEKHHGRLLDRLRRGLEDAGVVQYKYDEIFRSLF